VNNRAGHGLITVADAKEEETAQGREGGARKEEHGHEIAGDLVDDDGPECPAIIFACAIGRGEPREREWRPWRRCTPIGREGTAPPHRNRAALPAVSVRDGKVPGFPKSSAQVTPSSAPSRYKIPGLRRVLITTRCCAGSRHRATRPVFAHTVRLASAPGLAAAAALSSGTLVSSAAGAALPPRELHRAATAARAAPAACGRRWPPPQAEHT